MTGAEAHRVFLRQRVNARKKGHEFTITLKDWCDLWSEYYDRRGQMQLQRIDKEAGYVSGLLRIGLRQ